MAAKAGVEDSVIKMLGRLSGINVGGGKAGGRDDEK